MSPKPAPPVKDWEMVRCDNVDCETGKHLFPRKGLLVKPKVAALRRVPGTDDTHHLISTSEWGRVETYEPGFHEAIVNFAHGRKVWIDVEELTTLEGRDGS